MAVIRADATAQIGTGHVMRCIALAQAWQDRGGDVTFLSHCESDGLRQRILEEGFKFIPIENAYPHPSDLEKIFSVLSDEKNNAGWLVLDGYHFDTAFQKAIRDKGIRLLVIDDMNHLPHYHADILLNQNIHATDLKYSCDEDTILLMGCKYVMLRREFLKYREWKRIVPEKAAKILVTMGGSDPDNVTLKVIQALNFMNDADLEVKFVVGPVNPNLESIRKELSKSNFAYTILSNVKNMPELMAWADVAISAAGSTSWELLFMGVPSVIITIADNQKGIGESLSEKVGTIHIGWFEQLNSKILEKNFRTIVNNIKQRQSFLYRSERLIDGESFDRIFEIFSYKKLSKFDFNNKIRYVVIEDAFQIWQISNDPGVRLNSFNPSFIHWDDHINWFKNKINSDHTVFWVLEIGGVIGAQVRFDKISSEIAEIHFSVLPSFRGKNIASEIINNKFIKSCNKLDVSSVKGVVFEENAASEKVFEKSFFSKVGNEIIKGRKCNIYKRSLVL